ncbi:MAG: hypothetical protein HY912_15870 [Desulfomonile tiedjei]|uniref:Uncharacterized protein n=1 Tax=Desulfomonile tiedjei TaxID=2358 RepID=A0A9D6Z7C1_9BACT|nr:hypothetical protein [Desulfomonile tiedjei]
MLYARLTGAKMPEMSLTTASWKIQCVFLATLGFSGTLLIERKEILSPAPHKRDVRASLPITPLIQGPRRIYSPAQVGSLTAME